jgi:hypothetical protein
MAPRVGGLAPPAPVCYNYEVTHPPATMARTYRVILCTETGREIAYETHDKDLAIAEAERMNSGFADRGIPGWVASATWE